MTTILERFAEKNVTFSLADGELRIMAEPGTLTSDLLAEIRQDKMGLIACLNSEGTADPGRLRDGKPLCPMCDTTPAPAGAITTEADHITFVAVPPGVCPLCGIPLDRDGGECWHKAFHIGAEKAAEAPPDDDQPMAAPTACRSWISPVALSWLRENRAALQCNGWTMAELYRRNKSRGICWAGVWDMPGLSVALEPGGAISFRFQTPTGQKIGQTAWPRK